jgi:hypothetical protein
MGGALKTTRKVIDPFNIMDPAGILPGPKGGKFGTPSWKSSDGKKKKSGGGADGTGKYDPMMAYMSQMQAQQQAQAEAARAAQQAAFLEAQKQSAMASERQGETGAQQFLSQAGTMQQAKDISAQQAQQKAYQTAGISAIGGGFDIAKSQQEQAANLAGMGAIPTSAALPFYGMSDSTTTTPATRSANIFNLPKTSNIKFGGV